MRGPEEWPSHGSNPADRIRLTGPAATNFFLSLPRANKGDAGVHAIERRHGIPLSLLHTAGSIRGCRTWRRRGTIPRVSDSACIPGAASAVTTAAPTQTAPSRHSALVRVTHWITTLCFFALLVSGIEIVISHPRLYWGETGNDLTQPLFKLPIPASRSLVPTGYGYILPDQNGWSRYLHFQTAWLLVFTGLLYVVSGLLNGHFRNSLLPGKADLSWRAFSRSMADHLRFKRPSKAEAWSYNVLQRLSYLFVILVLFPFVIWTGLAMSPAFVSAFPATVNVLGGQQSARTLHFFVSLALVLFLLVHVGMVWFAGFRSRMQAMVTGRTAAPQEGA
jgi:thiosulfate reductase cytochrome b subunit